MVEEKELRKYADSWITICTVFLAAEAAGLAYLFSFFDNTDFRIEFIGIFGAGLLTSTFISLAFFLVARDPRGKFCVSKAIDIGVGFFAGTLMIANIGLFGNSLMIDRDPSVATALFIFFTGILFVFYPILYQKYTR